MDINDFRGIVTAVLLLAFVCLCVFAWSRGRKADYDASARLPLEEDRHMSDNERGNA